MATTTTNYGLTKPAYDDIADVGVINSNMDKIDEKIKENSDATASLQDSIDTINNSITSLDENKSNSDHTHTKSDIGLGNVDNTADDQKSVKYANSAGSASNAGTTTINGNWKKVEFGDGHGHISGFQGYSGVAINTAYGNEFFTSLSATIPENCRAIDKAIKCAITNVYANGILVRTQISNFNLSSGTINFYAISPGSKTNLSFYVQFMFEF